MQLSLRYGRGEVELSVPDGVAVTRVEPPVTRPLRYVAATERRELRHAVELSELRGRARRGGLAVVVVADRTRPCQYPEILPPVLDLLAEAGFPDDRIRLLVASGVHAEQSAEVDALYYGDDVCGRVAVEHHHADDPALVDLGRSPAGMPVALNRSYVEASVRVVIGPVWFHYFAGFGGGPKLVFPGLASREGILRNHRQMLHPEAGRGLDWRCAKGRIDGNPVLEDIAACARLCPPSLAVDVVPNADGAAARIFAGDSFASHRQACDFLRSHLTVRERTRYPVVIASAGGWPRDIDLVQLHKAIDNAFAFVKPDGALIVIGECTEGLGSQTLLPWFDYPSREAMERALHDEYTLNGGTALALRTKAEAVPIYLKSSLPMLVADRMGLVSVEDLDEVLPQILAACDDPAVAIIPNAAATVRLEENAPGTG